MKNNIPEIGDVVTLLSGGPKMTVNSVAITPGKPLENQVHCVWFAKDDDRFLNASLAQATLELPVPAPLTKQEKVEAKAEAAAEAKQDAADAKAEAKQDKVDAAQAKADAKRY
jgi:uncharacterized protein YodC (DUF2158 family)